MNRRALMRLAAGSCVVAAGGCAGCAIEAEEAGVVPGLEQVWGLHGLADGRLHKPRVAAIDERDELYVADLTDRIQVFDRDGNYRRGWRLPGLNIDGPSGLSISGEGEVLVADTHFYRVLVYSRHGELKRQIGAGVQGSAPGRFGFPTDVVRDSRGNYYVCEYGDNDRIQVFDSDGSFVRQWGGHGFEQGQFLRPRALVIDESDRLYVADSCNHRIQVFDTQGSLLHCWGERGSAPGAMAYPYDLALARGNALYVCEYGNSRVQKFSREGEPLGVWGKPGRRKGELDNPCALAIDSKGAIHVIDSGNHRVQRIRL